MTSPTARFYNRIRLHLTKEKDLPDFFVYHLTVEQEAGAATTQDIATVIAPATLQLLHGWDLTYPTGSSRGLSSL